MSGFKTHGLFSVVFLLAILLAVAWAGIVDAVYLKPIHFLALILGALMPDLDHPNSLIREWVTKLALACSVVLLGVSHIRAAQEYADIALLVLVPLFFVQFLSHRKWFHSISALLVLSVPLAIIIPDAALFFAAGFVSHLVLDGELSVF